MPRKTDPEFMRDLLVFLTEAMVYNDRAMEKVRKGLPLQTMISELNGNKLYLNQAMQRIATRMTQKAKGLV